MGRGWTSREVEALLARRRGAPPARASGASPPGPVRAVRRVLGVDTSLRSTGVAIVEVAGRSLRAVEYGRVRNPAARPLSACLAHLHRSVAELVARNPPSKRLEDVFIALTQLHTGAPGGPSP